MMTKRQGLGTATAVFALAMLAGCTPTPAATPTTSPLETTSVKTPSATPSATATSANPASPEAAINAAIQGYADFLNRAYTDPSVPSWQVGNFVNDVPPDYLGQAVQMQINQFRAEGQTQTGAGTMTVLGIEKQSDGGYLAKVCTDSSQIVVTDKSGKQMKSSSPRSLAEYTMATGKDGKWRTSRIKGTGSSC